MREDDFDLHRLSSVLLLDSGMGSSSGWFLVVKVNHTLFQSVSSVHIAGRENNSESLGRQLPRREQAEAAGRSGHDRDLLCLVAFRYRFHGAPFG